MTLDYRKQYRELRQEYLHLKKAQLASLKADHRLEKESRADEENYQLSRNLASSDPVSSAPEDEVNERPDCGRKRRRRQRGRNRVSGTFSLICVNPGMDTLTARCLGAEQRCAFRRDAAHKQTSFRTTTKDDGSLISLLPISIINSGLNKRHVSAKPTALLGSWNLLSSRA